MSDELRLREVDLTVSEQFELLPGSAGFCSTCLETQKQGMGAYDVASRLEFAFT